MNKTIYNRKNKSSIALNKKIKKNVSPPARFFAPPWKNPGYGPENQNPCIFATDVTSL